MTYLQANTVSGRGCSTHIVEWLAMADEEDLETAERLLEKSKEAFLLAVELYNRPSLKYHAESCSIFLCNAWELMLKAHLIKTEGLSSIYYKNHPEKTIALSDCLKKIFTNENDPLRINMSEIISFRNTNTHFITDEYEIFYGPFLQAGVNNYADKLMDLHEHSISDVMPENYLSLAVRRGSIDPEVIRAKYEPRVAERLLKNAQSVAEAAGAEGNGKIAAIYETTFRIVKKEKDADLNVFLKPNAEAGIAIVKDIQDIPSVYPFRTNDCIAAVNKQLKRHHVVISFRGQEKKSFSTHDFQLFVKAYSMKGDDRFSYDRKTKHEATSSWLYSQRVVEFIVEELKKDPQCCIDKLKQKVTK